MIRDKYTVKKLIAMICVMLLATLQILIIVPEAYAAQGGHDLVIRVQYIGERGDKVREIATFSRSEMSAMSAGTYYYSNITSVGGIMRTKANGPKVTTVLNRAGIDLGSVHNIYFRTTDGHGKHQRYLGSFSVSTISSEGWYYPNLMKHYKGYSDGTIMPLSGEEETTEPTEPTEPTDPTEPTTTEPATEPTAPTEKPTSPPDNDKPEGPADTGGLFMVAYGAENSNESALSGAVRVPAILAVTSVSTKIDSVDITKKSMGTQDSYRFCLGQTTLHENVRTTSADVSSAESAKYIFGIDVVLNGYAPIEGIELCADGTDFKVGSKTQIHAKVNGGDLTGFSASDLDWETNNKKLATVDENGLVTIKGEGPVTITASSGNGTTASITLNGTPGDSSDTGSGDSESSDSTNKDSNKTDADKTKDKKDVVVKKIYAKEINIGDEITPEEQANDQQSQQNVQALAKAEEYDSRTAAGAAAVAIGAFGISGALRVRKFFIDTK